MSGYITIAAADVRAGDEIWDRGSYHVKWVRVASVSTVDGYAVIRSANGVDHWRDLREGIAVRREGGR